jgi:GntR family transcriptional repressor for pyruvate dehydrogenase complex
MAASRTGSTVERIGELIQTGALRPGDRLPPEGDLASELAVSRSSLREAVRALTFMGVLRTRQGDGTYVTELDGATLLESLGFAVDLASDRTLLEFFQLRRLLEPAAAALAAGLATDTDLADLGACLARMEEAAAAGDSDRFIDADLDFHHTVTGVVGNEVLSGLLRALGLRSVRGHRWRARTDRAALDRSLAEHRAILDAVAAHDGDAARAAATAHLLAGERWLAERLAAGGL